MAIPSRTTLKKHIESIQFLKLQLLQRFKFTDSWIVTAKPKG